MQDYWPAHCSFAWKTSFRQMPLIYSTMYHSCLIYLLHTLIQYETRWEILPRTLSYFLGVPMAWALIPAYEFIEHYRNHYFLCNKKWRKTLLKCLQKLQFFGAHRERQSSDPPSLFNIWVTLWFRIPGQQSSGTNLGYLVFKAFDWVSVFLG